MYTYLVWVFSIRRMISTVSTIGLGSQETVTGPLPIDRPQKDPWHSIHDERLVLIHPIPSKLDTHAGVVMLLHPPHNTHMHIHTFRLVLPRNVLRSRTRAEEIKGLQTEARQLPWPPHALVPSRQKVIGLSPDQGIRPR